MPETGMANKLIQLKDGTDNLYPQSATEDIAVTTGTTQYAGYYYADGSTSLSGVKSVSIYGVTSNRPAFVQMITAQTFRVFSPVSSTTVTVRVVY